MTTGNNQELLSEKLNGELETISQQIETLRDKQVTAKLEGKPLEGASQIADLSAELEVVRRAHETAVAQEKEAEERERTHGEIQRLTERLNAVATLETTRLSAVRKAERATAELAGAITEIHNNSESIIKQVVDYAHNRNVVYLNNMNSQGRISERIARALSRLLPGKPSQFGIFRWPAEHERSEDWVVEEADIAERELSTIRRKIETQIEALKETLA